MSSKIKIESLLTESYQARLNNLNLSIELATNALLLCTGKKYDDLKAKAFSRLSLYYMITGKYDESFNLAQKGLALYEKLDDEKGIAETKYNIASIYYKTNDFQTSVVLLIDSLIIFKKHNDYHNISKCEKALGSIYDFTGNDQKAIHSNKNAIVAAKNANDLNLESNALNNLSAIYLKNDNIGLAKEFIESSIALKLKTNDLRGLAFSIYGKGKIFLEETNYLEAEKCFLKAIEIHEEMNEKFGLAMAYNKLAKLYFEDNKNELAKKYSLTGLDLCNYFNISIIKIKILYLIYSVYKKEENLPKSLEFLEIYIQEKEKVFNVQNFKVVENYDLLIKMQSMQKDAEFQKERNKLITKNNKTEQLSRIRQEFLSTMSHEIRTPLNAITTIATMLNEEKNRNDKSLIETLKFSSNHLMQIVNDILDYTKIDLGKMTLDFQPTEIKDFLNNFYNTYNLQAKEKSIQLKLITDSKLAKIYFLDTSKLNQILGNLLNNAVKFTDKGTITLELVITEKNAEFDKILFKVSDTGIGIEKENLKLVFDSFSQLKSGITRKKDGAGLGLSIVKKIIELHESEIHIESIVGKGSIFSFELTLKKSEDNQDDEINITEINIEGLNVLLAEDNMINAMIAKKLLSNWKITTDHAKNGLEATEKSKENKYDLILMDIHMPVLDGFEAAKNIRTLENFNSETPIFGLTADISAKDNTDYNHYFNGFLLKPIEIEKLKNALSSK